MDRTTDIRTPRTRSRPRIDAGVTLILIMGLLMSLQVAWIMGGSATVAASDVPTSSADAGIR